MCFVKHNIAGEMWLILLTLLATICVYVVANMFVGKKAPDMVSDSAIFLTVST